MLDQGKLMSRQEATDYLLTAKKDKGAYLRGNQQVRRSRQGMGHGRDHGAGYHVEG